MINYSVVVLALLSKELYLFFGSLVNVFSIVPINLLCRDEKLANGKEEKQ